MVRPAYTLPRKLFSIRTFSYILKTKCPETAFVVVVVVVKEVVVVVAEVVVAEVAVAVAAVVVVLVMEWPRTDPFGGGDDPWPDPFRWGTLGPAGSIQMEGRHIEMYI